MVRLACIFFWGESFIPVLDSSGQREGQARLLPNCRSRLLPCPGRADQSMQGREGIEEEAENETGDAGIPGGDRGAFLYWDPNRGLVPLHSPSHRERSEFFI